MHRLIIAALLLPALAGCSTTGDAGSPAAAPNWTSAPPAAKAAAEPRTEDGVRAAATEEFDSYAAGDYGEAWDVWYAPAKKLISRTAYVHLLALCPDPAAGARLNIEKVTMEGGGGAARVRASRLIAVLSYRFVYEAGHWRFVPTADNMRNYRTKTVQQITAERRAEGGCGKG